MSVQRRKPTVHDYTTMNNHLHSIHNSNEAHLGQRSQPWNNAPDPFSGAQVNLQSNSSATQALDSGFFDPTSVTTFAGQTGHVQLAQWHEHMLQVYCRNNKPPYHDAAIACLRGVLNIDEHLIRSRLNQLSGVGTQDTESSGQISYAYDVSDVHPPYVRSHRQYDPHTAAVLPPGDLNPRSTQVGPSRQHGPCDLHQYIANRAQYAARVPSYHPVDPGFVTANFSTSGGPQNVDTPRDSSSVVEYPSMGFLSEATSSGLPSSFSFESIVSLTSGRSTTGQQTNDGRQASHRPLSGAMKDIILRRIEDQRRKGCHPPSRASMQSGPFGCTLGCNQRFKSSADLIRHENTVWPQDFYFCNICGDPQNPSMKVLFTREDKIKAHLKKFHRSKLDTRPHRIYGVRPPFLDRCYKCNIRFNDWESRRDHIKSHCRHDRGRRFRGRRRSIQPSDAGEDEDDDDDNNDSEDARGEEEEDNAQDKEDDANGDGPPRGDHSNDPEDHDGNDNNDASGANGDTSHGSSNGNGNDSEPADGGSGSGASGQDFADLCHWDSPTSCNQASYHTMDPCHGTVLVWREKINNKGGTSSIYRAELISSLRTNVLSKASLFAVKQYTFHHRESFRREAEAFRVLQMLGVRTESLLLCLGIFLDVGPWGQPTFNLLLELGKGDLTTYWATASPERSGVVTSWLLGQMYGLTEALLHIHTCGHPNDRHDGVGLRHGDIKPENILWFPEAEKRQGTFKIADFGLSAVHSSRSQSLSALGGTLRYSAPEVSPSRSVSQAYDVWSLGCVFLELLVWTIDGYDALQEFRHKKPAQSSDAQHRPTSGFHIGYNLDPDIRLYYRRLRRHIPSDDWATSQMLDVIEHHMLQIDPEKRFTASELMDRHVEIMQSKDQAQRLLIVSPVRDRKRRSQVKAEVSIAPRGLELGPLDEEIDSFDFGRQDVMKAEPIWSWEGELGYDVPIDKFAFTAFECYWGACSQSRSGEREFIGCYITSRVNGLLEGFAFATSGLDGGIWIDALCIIQQERDVCSLASQKTPMVSHNLWPDGCPDDRSDGYTLTQVKQSSVYNSGAKIWKSLQWGAMDTRKTRSTKSYQGTGTAGQKRDEDAGCMSKDTVELRVFDSLVIEEMVLLLREPLRRN